MAAFTIKDLIALLQKLPPEWRVSATKSGDSLLVWEGASPWDVGTRRGYVFTDGRRPKLLTNKPVEPVVRYD